MANQTIILGFEGQEYRVEAPVTDKFTGSVTLVFHWKEGKLLQAQASKSASASIVDNPTMEVEKPLINNGIPVLDS